MKMCITLGFALGILLLVGCATPHDVTKWQHKVAYLGTVSSGDPKAWTTEYQAFLDNFGKDGWMLVSQDNSKTFYFKRPIK